MDAAGLGWTPAFDEPFAPYRGAGPGAGARQPRAHAHLSRASTGAGEWLARVSGRLRHHAASRADFPAVGDWVAVEPPRTSGDARIQRRAAATQPLLAARGRRSTEEQVVAANIDTVFLVGGLDRRFQPAPDRALPLVAWESGATPVIVLNKADLVDDPADARRRGPRARAGGRRSTRCRARQPGVARRRCARISAPAGPAALLGSSGVGKSTIVNRLVGHELLRTQRRARVATAAAATRARAVSWCCCRAAAC